MSLSSIQLPVEFVRSGQKPLTLLIPCFHQLPVHVPECSARGTSSSVHFGTLKVQLASCHRSFHHSCMIYPSKTFPIPLSHFGLMDRLDVLDTFKLWPWHNLQSPWKRVFMRSYQHQVGLWGTVLVVEVGRPRPLWAVPSPTQRGFWLYNWRNLEASRQWIHSFLSDLKSAVRL